ncbi:lipopolysaccharide biosynthesis protein [Colwelliaceae bacterium 6441]
MSEDSQKLVSGAVWMLLTRMVIKSLGIVSSVVLARLLVPEDFGLVAVVMAIYAFFNIFSAAGFNSALIQQKKFDPQAYSTVWTTSVIFAISAFIIFIISAPYIALYYEDARLENIMYAVAASFLLQGFYNTGVVHFQQNQDFRQEFYFQVLPKLVSFFTTLGLAFTLKSYWALVIGMLFHQLLTLITSYVMHKFRPFFTLKGFRKLFTFSKWIILNQLLYFFNNFSISLIVGKTISSRAAGLMGLSVEMASFPVTEMVAPINKAAYPAYVKASENLARLNKLYLESLNMVSMIVLPAVIGIYLTAPLFVPTVLGDKWLETIPLIQAISLASLFLGLQSTNGYLMMAIGKPQLSTLNGLIRAVFMLGAVIMLSQSHGIKGAAAGLLISSVIGFLFSYFLIWMYLKLSLITLFKSVMSPVLAVGAMFITVSLVNIQFSELNNLILLLLLMLVGGITYIAIIILFWRLMGCPDGIEKKFLNMVRVRVLKLDVI